MDANRTVGIRSDIPAAAAQSSAFSLIELLVTIAVIAILSSLLLPTLSRAKNRGQQAFCLNNIRQLGTAWFSYAQEHHERLPYNLGATEIAAILRRGQRHNWANSVLNWEVDPNNTNTLLNTDAALGAYASRSAAIFHCPSDRTVSSLQRRAGWHSRSRTISMNAMVGDPGEFLQSGSNVNNPYHRQYLALNEIESPSSIFVFVEEHPDSINDGYFLNKAYSGEWTDLPASFHNFSANLSFADGHQESRRWIRPSTRAPAKPDAVNLPMRLPREDRADLNWLVSRMSVH